MTEYSEAMARIVRRLHPRLKGAGFKKRRHTFNRSADAGVVQVVNFQMGPKLPPGATALPPIRVDLWGRFTVNLGVAVREAWEKAMGSGRSFPAFINEYDCQIRERLGRLTGEVEDKWWPLDDASSAVADAVGSGLVRNGLEWLEGRSTRAAILHLWEAGGREALPITTAVPVVMILRELNRHDEAEQTLRSYYETVTDNVAHRRYLHDLARSLGIGGLASP